MKKVFVHIGLHKTGSTYIQRVFADNRSILRKNGVDYPMLGAEFLFGHHNIAWSLMPGKALIQTADFSIARLAQYINDSKFKYTVLSSEEFDFLKVEQISTLKQILSNVEVKIILYVRHPLNAFYSVWQEAVKHGEIDSVEAFFEKLSLHPQSLDYLAIAKRWTHLFGVDALLTVVYDNLVEKNINIFTFFLQKILQVDADMNGIVWPHSKVNPASNIEVVEVLRQLNVIHQAEGYQGNLAGRLTKYISRTEPGIAIQNILLGIRDKPLGYLELQPLSQMSEIIEQEFIQFFRGQAVNAANEQSLFLDSLAINEKLPLLDIARLRHEINLHDLYREIMQ